MNMVQIVLTAKFAIGDIDKVGFTQHEPQLFPVGNMGFVIGLVAVEKRKT